MIPSGSNKRSRTNVEKSCLVAASMTAPAIENPALLYE